MQTDLLSKPKPIVYPESDGQPMAENTLQFRWITMVKDNLEAAFAGQADVFVAGDLFWYPVEGDPTIRQAPDILVAFGRPRGDRSSYMQWLEGRIAPQVVWEILSPGNRTPEMIRKSQFYERYGVEEYYLYDPETGETSGWRRVAGRFEPIPNMNGWVSPRLQVRFEIVNGELRLYRPDGTPFLTFMELQKEHDEMRRIADAQATRIEELKQKLRSQGIDPDKP